MIIADLEQRIWRHPVLSGTLKRIPGVYQLLDAAREYRDLRVGLRRGSFSQHAEDRFLLEYFAGRRGSYIDVGASHPFRISNTYLLYCNGWSGVTLEPIPKLIEKHRRLRPLDVQLRAAAGQVAGLRKFYELAPSVLSTFDESRAVALVARHEAIIRRVYEVEVLTVTEVYNRYVRPRQLDFLSLDAEGHEMAILRGLDFGVVAPKLIACEIPASIPNPELRNFITDRGYRALYETECNVFFELC